MKASALLFGAPVALALFSVATAQEPAAIEWPSAITEPRPAWAMAGMVSRKVGIPIHYEDVLVVFEGDVTDLIPLPAPGQPPRKMRVPVARSSTVKLDVTHPGFHRAGLDITEPMQRMLTGYSKLPHATGGFDLRIVNGAFVVVPTWRRDRNGVPTAYTSPFEKEIRLPSAQQTPGQRLEAICKEISFGSEVPVKPATGIGDFDRGFTEGSSLPLSWEEDTGSAREVLLRFLAASPRPYLYHLLCIPNVEDAGAYCFLNVSTMMLEIKDENGQVRILHLRRRP